MASLFDKINLTSILIALSILTVFAIFQVIDHVEYNSAFGSFHENPIIPITSESEFLTYDDIITGFSIKYPPDWERAQHIDKSVTFLAPRESNLDTNPAGINIQVLESIETTFLGHPAHMIIFTATDNTQNLRKAMQVWFKEDTKAYLITYKSDKERFSKYLPTIDKMLNSFYTYKN